MGRVRAILLPISIPVPVFQYPPHTHLPIWVLNGADFTGFIATPNLDSDVAANLDLDVRCLGCVVRMFKSLI